MNFEAADDGSLLLNEIPPFLFWLLSEIPARASSNDPRVEGRFFPDPAADEDLVQDWKSLVHPELHELFQSARETVRADLRSASEKDGTHALRIPPSHADAWLGALNQARLAIAEESGFDEKDMAAEPAPTPDDPRAIALFQISFYGFIQEILVRMQS
jgi:hypothetical protein